jgi:hypothetical protein
LSKFFLKKNTDNDPKATKSKTRSQTKISDKLAIADEVVVPVRDHHPEDDDEDHIPKQTVTFTEDTK